MKLITAVILAAAAFTGASGQATLQSNEVNHLLYDARLGRLVILAGSKASGLEQVWVRGDGGWTLMPAPGPAARELGGAAWDARRQRIVVHGGMSRGGSDRFKADTWEWDGRAWHQVSDTAVGGRDHHALAYDEHRGRTVLYGGQGTEDALSQDTWEWDGSRWTRMATAGPGGRAHFALTYDARRRQVVLIGGLDERYRVHGDTWAWDGRAWLRVSEQGPPARSHHRVDSDPHIGTIVLFGGLRGGDPKAALGDTWVWDGQGWRQAAAAGPPARSGHAMAYDAGRRRVVLYGGGSFDGKTTTRHDDLWECDGARWTEVR